jgi:hypothetical protein
VLLESFPLEKSFAEINSRLVALKQLQFTKVCVTHDYVSLQSTRNSSSGVACVSRMCHTVNLWDFNSAVAVGCKKLGWVVRMCNRRFTSADCF